MQLQDDFTLYHKDLLDGHYDCVDRIVLNGYFPLGQQGGGFRTWWRMLNGSDDGLDQKHLQNMAGRFSRRLRGIVRPVHASMSWHKPICHKIHIIRDCF